MASSGMDILVNTKFMTRSNLCDIAKLLLLPDLEMMLVYNDGETNIGTGILAGYGKLVDTLSMISAEYVASGRSRSDTSPGYGRVRQN